MAGIINYKAKYEELKYRFMSSIDAAWQDGYRHGMETSEKEQNQQMISEPQAEQQSEEMQLEPVEQATEQNAEQNTSNAPHEDELGKHIQKLESMLGKGELGFSDTQELKKTLNDIRSLQVQINLSKSLNSIKSTKLAKSFSPKVKANLPQQAQKNLTMQEEIVKNVFEKWEKEATNTASDIGSILNIEGLTKPKNE